MKKILLLSLLAIMAIVSCKKENFEHFTPSTSGFEQTNVTANFSGLIVGPDEKGLQGVSVTNGTNTTITDENGIFFFNNITVPNTKAYFTAKKAGYFHGSRTLFVQANQNHRIFIKMLSSASVGSFTNSSGGTISLTQGAKVIFDANDVAYPNGNAYSGQVNVAAKKIDPSTQNGRFEMPGDLRGIDTEGNMKTLISYGMLAIELTDDSGNLLQVAPNQTVTISYDLSGSQQANAPQSIPLWYFDEATGDWKEEGAATLSGNTYTGEVSHFTFWNYDDERPPIMLTAKFIDSTGTPIEGLWIQIEDQSTGWMAQPITNSNGTIMGPVASNAAFKLYVFSANCQENAFIMDFSTTDVDLDLGTITVDPIGSDLSFHTATGNLIDCSELPIANGYVSQEGDTWFSTNFVAVGEDGSFALPISTCTPTEPVYIYGYDNDAELLSEATPVYLTESTIDVGNIQACATTWEHEFYTINFTSQLGNDTTITLISPPDFIDYFEANSSFIKMTANAFDTTSTIYYTNILFMYDATSTGTFSGDLVFAGAQQPCTITLESFPTISGEFAIGSFITEDTEINGSFKIRKD